jgi:ribosomal protein S18 acetylase RimI-like enzyme
LKPTFEETPDPSDVQFINERLREYNRLHAEDDNHRLLAVFLRNADHNVVGGLVGGTYWGWLHIDVLWVREDLRHAGHGQALLQIAEEEAIRRGCKHAHLETHSFQALSFYEKQGYTIFGQLSDLPKGHIKYYLKKTLKPDTAGM